MSPEKITEHVEPHEVVLGTLKFKVYGDGHDPTIGEYPEPGHVIRAACDVLNVWDNRSGVTVDLGIIVVGQEGKIPTLITHRRLSDRQITIDPTLCLFYHGKNQPTTLGCIARGTGVDAYPKQIKTGDVLGYLVLVNDSK